MELILADMSEFKTGQWAICDGAYVQIEQPAYRRGLMVCRIAGSDRRKCISIKRLTPSSLTPDFSDAKVGDECFSPIHGIGYFTMMKHKWGETTVVYDNGVMDYAVCAKSTTTHPLRYNSFAQFQAYWAEKALEMGGEK
jgi:hypothetical protein